MGLGVDRDFLGAIALVFFFGKDALNSTVFALVCKILCELIHIVVVEIDQ